MPRRWYVAQTGSRQEGVAVENLERQAFQSFCPRFPKLRRHARRVETVLEPLFPGYVFVRFDVSIDPWRSINGTRGVSRLVGANAARPLPMPEAAMTHVRRLCEGGAESSGVDSIRVGDPVRILSGPFAEQLATVQSLHSAGRIRVLLGILGGEAPLQLAAGAVAPVGP